MAAVRVSGCLVYKGNTFVVQTEVAKALLQRPGGKQLLEAKDETGQTALHCAVRAHQHQTALFLVVSGAAIDVSHPQSLLVCFVRAVGISERRCPAPLPPIAVLAEFALRVESAWWLFIFRYKMRSCKLRGMPQQVWASCRGQ